MQKKKFKIRIEPFILNPLDKTVFDIPLPEQEIEVEEEHAFQTILKIKEPTYPKIKEELLKIAYHNYIAIGEELKFAALISIYVESDSHSVLEDNYENPNETNEPIFEFVCKYITRFEPTVRHNNDGIDVINSTLWRKK